MDELHMSATSVSYASRRPSAMMRNLRLRGGLREIAHYLRRPWWRRLRKHDQDAIWLVDRVLAEVWGVVKADLALAADPDNMQLQKRLRDELSVLTAGYIR